MKAAVYHRYGGPEVVSIADVPTPAVGDREVLIRVHATTVTTGDWRARSLQMPAGFGLLGRLVFGVTKPRQPILGTELAGEITAIGANVRSFAVGDRVFAFPGAKMGCHVEYKCVREDGPIVKLPSALTYAQAAALSFGGITALHFCRRGKLQVGERMLVNGASGNVGSAMVQIAKAQGAHVTGVCSGKNVALVESLGAERAIDYAKEDFAAGAERYDVVVDVAGTAPWSRSKRVLTDKGRLFSVLGSFSELLRSFGNRRIIAGPAGESVEDLRALAALADGGKLVPVIGATFPLDRIVDAHREVDSGHKRGSVVVTI
ncbi:MAG: NAD(P)-dependent alcohol dehydrogenase [Deltaproteobacteria bacterium]|nr:NAD(P)-dependent alcohol dehydrogenase [Deltaproteobacteria bacterium]